MGNASGEGGGGMIWQSSISKYDNGDYMLFAPVKIRCMFLARHTLKMSLRRAKACLHPRTVSILHAIIIL